MSTFLSSQPLPSLFSITMTDWLPKLGEKAFLAWLRMHSWRTDPVSSDPILLPLSLNRITKKLRVGHSTFYDHILRPLWNFGLIDLKPAAPGQKHQLIVYSYPMNDPQKSSDPLLQIRDYDLSSTAKIEERIPMTEPAIPSDLHHSMQGKGYPSENDAVLSSDDPLHQKTFSSVHEHSPTYESKPACEQHLEPEEKITSLYQKEDLFLLPPKLQSAIHADVKLREKADSILEVYLIHKHDPRFTVEFFLEIIHRCIRYSPNPKCFTSYLNKAIANEWTKGGRRKFNPMNEKKVRPRSRPKDVPEWVWNQGQNQPMECSPEQKAILQGLMKDLGEG